MKKTYSVSVTKTDQPVHSSEACAKCAVNDVVVQSLFGVDFCEDCKKGEYYIVHNSGIHSV